MIINSRLSFSHVVFSLDNLTNSYSREPIDRRKTLRTLLFFRMQQQSGPGNGNTRRTLSPGPGGSDSEDSDISLGGASPVSPNASPPPNHQPSPVPLGSLGPLPTPSLNFRFDPTQPQFRFGHTTPFKFPPTGFRFGPHSPQPNHPTMPSGGIFRIAETSPFQAIGPRGDVGSRYQLL